MPPALRHSPLHAPRSARLEALACYLACLVRPVWLEPLVPAAFVDAKASGAPPIVGRLPGVLTHLAPLHAFLQRHTQLFDDERAMVSVVGDGLATGGASIGAFVGAVESFDRIVASPLRLSALVPREALGDVQRRLHARFVVEAV